MLVTLMLGVWWDDLNDARSCVLVVLNGRIIAGLDAETREFLADPAAALPVLLG